MSEQGAFWRQDDGFGVDPRKRVFEPGDRVQCYSGLYHGKATGTVIEPTEDTLTGNTLVQWDEEFSGCRVDVGVPTHKLSLIDG